MNSQVTVTFNSSFTHLQNKFSFFFIDKKDAGDLKDRTRFFIIFVKKVINLTLKFCTFFCTVSAVEKWYWCIPKKKKIKKRSNLLNYSSLPHFIML